MYCHAMFMFMHYTVRKLCENVIACSRRRRRRLIRVEKGVVGNGVSEMNSGVLRARSRILL